MCKPIVSFTYAWTHFFQLERAIKDKLEINMTLEQDGMEGVDDEEWVR